MSDPFDLSDAAPEPGRQPADDSSNVDAPHKAGHDDRGGDAPHKAGHDAGSGATPGHDATGKGAPRPAGPAAGGTPAPAHLPGGRSISAQAMAAFSAPWLDALNPEQRQAAEALDGAVLVLAGAGTGKTRVLVTRLAHILATRRAWPSQILAVTFTNKAAREMRERVEGLVGGSADGLWLGTFHSICARLLRRHAERIGLKPTFTILDTDDQLRLLKQLLAAENIDDKKWPARALNAIIQRWKDRGLTPARVTVAEAGEFANGRAVTLYKQYQERLKVLNACDFGDLLLHCLTLFGENADVLAEYQAKFKYMLVDEYQDTNVAQYLWLRLLAQGGGNICCVGDDDQSIYGWRGAEVGNILRFEKDFPGAKVIRLERNYRSTPQILAAASRPDRPQRRAPRQDALDRGRRRRQGARHRRVGRRDRGAHGGRGDRGAAAGRHQPRRDRGAGARGLPDPRVRGTLHRPGGALPRDRRPALLRARRDPRRHRVFARDRPARRRPRLRAHRQRAAARAWARPPSRRCTGSGARTAPR